MSLPAAAETGPRIDAPKVAAPKVAAPRATPKLSNEAPPVKPMNVEAFATGTLTATTGGGQPPTRTLVETQHIKITGLSRGAVLHGSVQAPSEVVEIPKPSKDGPVRSAQSLKKEMRRAVAAAGRETPVFETTADVDSSKDPLRIDTVTNPDKEPALLVHAPLTIRGTDVLGRRIPTARATVAGQRTQLATRDLGEGRTQTQSTGGMVTDSAKPWVTKENLYTTPSYVDDKNRSVIKVLGLAAFPRNAVLKFYNKRMLDEGGHDVEGGITTFDRLNASGSGDLILPAIQGDRIILEVTYPGTPYTSNSEATSITFKVPFRKDVKDMKPAFKTNSGLGYFPVAADD